MTGMGDVVIEAVDGLRAVLIRRYGGRVRVAYDPQMVDERTLARLLAIYG